MAYKVFTNGSVLPASDLNTYLMDQSVMVFSSSATRAAALTAPVEGMLTWLEDVNRYEYRDGSGAWVSLGDSALTLLASQAVTATNTLIIDNVFSTTYDAYKMIVSGTSGGGVDQSINFRVGGVNASTNYTQSYIQGSGATVTAGRDTSQTTASIGRFGADGGFIDVTLHGVALAQRTYGVSLNMEGTGIVRSSGLIHTTATAYDGIRFTFGGTTTGRVRIYGLRNS